MKKEEMAKKNKTFMVYTPVSASQTSTRPPVTERVTE